MSLYGKGYYIWKIPYCEGGNPAAIAERARAAGLSHVLIKIADGSSWPYNFDFDRNHDFVPAVRSALKEHGIEVWGWHYVRGDNPLGEARLGLKRMRELNLDGYVIDAEVEYQQRGKAAAAAIYMNEIRKGLPDTPVALSTFRYPRSHWDFPFDAFLEKCDYSMPQVYFEQAHNPEEQLARSVEQYLALTYARPVIPTAPTYIRGDWRPSAGEIQRFLQKARDMGLTAVNAWSWDFATRPQFVHLWNAVADFDWPAGPPVADFPERLLGRMNQSDPNFVAELYSDKAAHVTGDRTVIGREAVRDWYQRMFTEILPKGSFELTGKNGSGGSRRFMWKATSSNGDVYDGNDTLGILDGKIQYHYTYFTVN
jgi:hypothetical protein